MNAQQMVAALIDIENKQIEPDVRRVIRDARMALQAALQQGEGIGTKMDCARDIADAWGHTLPGERYRSGAYAIFRNAKEAYAYADKNNMAIDEHGLVTSGCEGVGADEWRKIRAAEEVIRNHICARRS